MAKQSKTTILIETKHFCGSFHAEFLTLPTKSIGRELQALLTMPRFQDSEIVLRFVPGTHRTGAKKREVIDSPLLGE